MKKKKDDSEDEGSIASDWSGEDSEVNSGNDNNSDSEVDSDESDGVDEALMLIESAEKVGGLQQLHNFSSMNRKELIQRQRALLEELRDVLGCDRSVARKMLKFFKWNLNDAISAYSSDASKVAKVSQIPL